MSGYTAAQIRPLGADRRTERQRHAPDDRGHFKCKPLTPPIEAIINAVEHENFPWLCFAAEIAIAAAIVCRYAV